MTLGAAADDDNGIDTKYCEIHYNFFKEQNYQQKLYYQKNKKKKKKKQLKKKSSSEEEEEDDDDSSSSGTEIWDSNSLVANHRKGIRHASTSSHIDGGSRTKRKEIERNELSDFTDILTENPSWMTSDKLKKKKKKKKEMEKMMLPPDEQRCSHTTGTGSSLHKRTYRCKNFRMNHGAADASVRKSKHCEKHYNQYAQYHKNLMKNTSGNDEASLIPSNKMKLNPDEQRCCHTDGGKLRCKNFRMSHGAAADDDTVPKTKYCEKHYIYYAEYNRKKRRNGEGEGEGAAGPIRRKRKTLEKTEGSEEPEWSTGTSRMSNKDSHVYELRTRKRVLKNVYDTGTNRNHELESQFPQHSAVNISSGSQNLSGGVENLKQGKGWGCGEQTPSQTHLEKPFVNLISENSGEFFGEFIAEDFDTSSDSKGSLGDHTDKKIKWKFECDMLSSFEEDPVICMKAVCALYRQQISEDAKGLFHCSDAPRGTTLAKFLMDGARKGDLKKSIIELETLDSKAVEDCKRLARSYSKQLFSIYQHRTDPYFLFE